MRFGKGDTSARRSHRAWGQIKGVVLLLGLLALPFSGIAAQTAAVPATVRVLVEGKPAVSLDRQALAAMPRTRIDTAATHHEPAAQWQGVRLEDVLQRAGAVSGEQLRGHGMTTIVRITASDNYQIVFSLGELDPMLGNEHVVLVDTKDGQPLTKDGPFRLVVPGDKRPARWIRNVITIEVSNDRTRP
ncbi:molybdopterin-binding protein [Dyella monticola]|uniref:Molybdopterin-binding protein n=1 Tax=Dyella monticola TaxID=1927958 RepID=A0A370WVM3_9GAMM|nr:molybdopterin-dependent oxidoreductase [Dyella monticola]RDS80192.1 molybdopterin-binding protein [Dyella monticola]